jgi:tetratricopeptide (TPR) repeat protein
MPRRHLFVLLASALLLSACSMNRLIANNMVGAMGDMRAAFFAEQSPDQGFHAGPALLKQLDGFILSAPDNEELLLKAAELNCGYALTFLDLSDPQWAAHQYRKGKGYALRGLAEVNAELAEAIRNGDEEALDRLLPQMDVDEDLPFVFFTGLCWGGLMNATQDVTMAADLPLVEKLFEASLDKNPAFYYGAGYAFFGMLFAGRSEMLGGDLEKGRENFEKAIAVTDGQFLLTKVMYARAYAVNKQDAPLYVRLLNEVAGATFEDPPEMALPNAVARRDARTLLGRIADFFPGYSGKTGLEPQVAPLEEEDIDLDLD